MKFCITSDYGTVDRLDKKFNKMNKNQKEDLNVVLVTLKHILR